MKLEEYCRLDGLGLAELICKGEISASEALECAVVAVGKVNPAINSVVELLDRDVMAGQGAAGPFAGVPFLIKDILIHMAGVRAESASKLGADIVAPEDSALMARYRAAGLVTFGRTNAPEFGFNVNTEPLYHGSTRNPWNPALMAGGSSGGSAAAVAAGVVPMAHANDGGGSIRIPASCCGLVGMKPTRGRVSLGPDMGDALAGFGIEHAVTRTVRDSAALLDACQGPSLGDPYEIAPPARPFLDEIGADPGKLRIAFATQPWSSAPVDPEVAEAVQQTAKVLAELGHALAEDKPVCDWEPFISATADIWSVGVAGWVLGTDAGRNVWRETVESSVIACVERGIEMSALDYSAAVAQMNVVTRTVAPFFADYDLLVTPTLALPPQPLGTYDANASGLTALSWSEHIFSFAAFTPLFNATGHPAISLPLAQTRAGLPIGIQIVAPFGREDMLFRVAAQLEQAMDWSGRQPQIFAGALPG